MAHIQLQPEGVHVLIMAESFMMICQQEENQIKNQKLNKQKILLNVMMELQLKQEKGLVHDTVVWHDRNLSNSVKIIFLNEYFILKNI